MDACMHACMHGCTLVNVFTCAHVRTYMKCARAYVQCIRLCTSAHASFVRPACVRQVKNNSGIGSLLRVTAWDRSESSFAAANDAFGWT